MESEIRRFLRRLRWGRFVGATAQALAVLAIGAAVVLLTLRLVGWSPTLAPEAAWLLLLAPAYGLLAVRRLGFSRTMGAAHLDRRLGMDGLLVTALERDAAAYAPAIHARLAEARSALPRIRLRGPSARLGIAALVILVLAWLPVRSTPAGVGTILTESLDAYEAKLEALEERGALKAERKEAYEERLVALKSKVDRGEHVDWKDLDAIQEALAQEEALEGARLERARRDFAALSRSDDGVLGGASRAPAERMAALLPDADRAGLLDRLPDGMAAKLDAMGAAPSSAEVAAAFDENGLKKLAAALAETADQKLAGLPPHAFPPGTQLPTLEELMTGVDMGGVYGEACGRCEGERGLAGAEGRSQAGRAMVSQDGLPGRGGVTRGRGDAPLRYTNQTEGATDAFRAKKLPPGQRPSREWERTGLRRSAPTVEPRATEGGGSAGVAGAGEASWRRRLAPRHRGVVRRFFEGETNK